MTIVKHLVMKINHTLHHSSSFCCVHMKVHDLALLRLCHARVGHSTFRPSYRQRRPRCALEAQIMYSIRMPQPHSRRSSSGYYHLEKPLNLYRNVELTPLAMFSSCPHVVSRPTSMQLERGKYPCRSTSKLLRIFRNILRILGSYQQGAKKGLQIDLSIVKP